MKLGRIENDTRWNYGLEIRKAPEHLDVYELSVWLFKQSKVAEAGYRYRVSKGFMFITQFGFFGRIISFRVPSIRWHIW